MEAPHATEGSSMLTASWSAVPGACIGFSLHHYRVVLKEGTWPTNPTDGIVFTTSGTTRDMRVNRAERGYYARVYACQNSSCTDKYGDDFPETVMNDYDYAVTDQEVWVVTGVEPLDTGEGVIHGSTGAASAFFRPTGWTNAGKLQVYYDSGAGIETKVASTAGWQNFNAASWSTETWVAGNHVSNTDFGDIGHSYPFPVTWGNTKAIQLLVQNNDGDGMTLNEHVLRADSTDEDGDDFGLDCDTNNCCDGGGDGPCDWPGDGMVEICADESATCYELNEALHGRWMWDLAGSGVPDLEADSPRILFSGRVDDVTCDTALYGHGDQQDVFSATWDNVNEVWEVEMYDIGGGVMCPEENIPDAHDPGIVALDGDDFKVYVMTWDSPHAALTYYWDGSAWESETASPRIIFDDAGGTEVSHDCIANFEGVFRFVSGTNHQGVLFDGAQDGADPYEGSICTSGFGAFGVYFAELSN